MTIENIRCKALEIAKLYPIKKITLFGSRATDVYKENSDVDLIIEFTAPITLFTIMDIKLKLQDMLGVDVDIIHGPIRSTDFLEIGKTVELYAA